MTYSISFFGDHICKYRNVFETNTILKHKFLSIYLSIYLSAYLSIYLSIYLFISHLHLFLINRKAFSHLKHLEVIIATIIIPLVYINTTITTKNTYILYLTSTNSY